jgi:hypothetical protein
LKLATLPAGVTAHLHDNPGGSVQLVVTAVAPPEPPQIGGFSKLGDSNFSLAFTGAFGPSYSMRASTNVALPVAGWTIMGSGTFGSGGVIHDDLAATNYLQRSILISVH